MFKVKVFGKNSRRAVMEATGFDAKDMANKIAASKHITKGEREHVREGIESTIVAINARSIPGLTDAQIDIGGRRIRVASLA